jgi:hypothetical protein
MAQHVLVAGVPFSCLNCISYLIYFYSIICLLLTVYLLPLDGATCHFFACPLGGATHLFLGICKGSEHVRILIYFYLLRCLGIDPTSFGLRVEYAVH